MPKKKKGSSRKRSSKRTRLIYISGYEITSDPIPDERYDRLPPPAKEDLRELHFLVMTNPRQAISKSLRLIELFPNLPRLYNYLSVAYHRAGDSKSAEETVFNAYRRFPDYLFARLNYAEIFLDRREYEKVAEILEYKFDLPLLCPNRSRFHTSEFVAFASVMAQYFLGIGKRELAEAMYGMMQEVAPDNLATLHLHTKLHRQN